MERAEYAVNTGVVQMSERVSGAAGVSGEDLSMLESQLGREPSGVLKVERYCPAGHPQVIRYYPLSLSPEAEVLSPFPTLFWLTCPSLIRQVSEFESYGWIGKIEEKIRTEPDFREEYHENHRSYCRERWETLLPRHREAVIGKGWEAVYRDTGIGGIRDWDFVKCLHLQYAHQVGSSNVVGRFLQEQFSLRSCKPPRSPVG